MGQSASTSHVVTHSPPWQVSPFEQPSQEQQL
jgi:hypothetical protein